MSRGRLLFFPPEPRGPAPQPAGDTPDRPDWPLRRLQIGARGHRASLDSKPSPSARTRHGSIVPLAMLTGLGLLALVIGLAHGKGELDGVPPAERERLYQQTLASLQTACIPPRSWSPSDYCLSQIRAVLAFPECGPSCRTLVQQAGHRPMK